MEATKRSLKLLIISLLVIFTVNSTAIAADPLLEMLPAETLVCVRINNFDMALSQLDAYLTGTSPLPIGMLAKGQLGQIVGDPMLTGIDTGGNVCFAMFSHPESGDPIGGLLVPMTSFDDFVAKNPNCSKNEAGAIILTSPNSPMGNFELTELADGKYALVLPQTFGTINQVKAQITSTNKALQTSLSAAQAKEAVTAPAWVYINAQAMYDKYSQAVLGELESSQENISSIMENPAMAAQMGPMSEMIEMYFNIYAELFKTFGADADSITLALTPDAGNLSLDLSLKAKKGSETAAMLDAGPTSTNNYSMTGYLDNDNAVNGVMKMNIASMQMMYDKMFDILDKANTGKIKSGTVSKMKSFTQKYIATMGNEIAFSFSYAGVQPPIKLVEVIKMKDMKTALSLTEDSMSLVGDLYTEMGMPMTFKYNHNTGTYKDATLDTMTISFPKSDNAADPMSMAMEQIYGDGFVYQVAHTDDKYYMTMGGDAEAALKKAVDQDGTAPATGEVKAAIDTLSKAGYGDFACSVNVIKLITGLGEMIESMGAMHPANQSPVPQGLFAIAKSIPSQSSLALGGKSSDGEASLRLVLPKQHLMELMSMAMQMQQQMMMQQMQSQQSNTNQP